MSSSTRVIFDPKRASEGKNFPFDFISLLASGETISSQVVTATVWSGVDATPNAIVSGSATVSGTIVTQKIVNGVSGVIYLLKCAITTSASQTLALEGLLAILPEGI